MHFFLILCILLPFKNGLCSVGRTGYLLIRGSVVQYSTPSDNRGPLKELGTNETFTLLSFHNFSALDRPQIQRRLRSPKHSQFLISWNFVRENVLNFMSTCFNYCLVLMFLHCSPSESKGSVQLARCSGVRESANGGWNHDQRLLLNLLPRDPHASYHYG